MKKILIGAAAVIVVGLVVLVVVLTLSLGSLVKKGVETVGPQITKTEMKLDKASISVLSGSGTLHGFLLGNPQGYKTPSAVQVGEVSVGVQPGSVLSDKIHVTHVRVKAPEITFEGTLGTQNNLSKILDNVNSVAGGADKGGDKTKTEPADKGGKGASRKLQVDDFLISGAMVKVSLTSLGGKSLTVPLPEIHLTNLGAGPEWITAAELTKIVLAQVTTSTLEAVEKGVANMGKAAADAAKAATDPSKAVKSIGNLFQPKK